MSRPLAPRGGNDKVYTPPDMAKQIVAHFQPTGPVLEPCCGKGAFTDALAKSSNCGPIYWMEKDCGTDFLDPHLTVFPDHYIWIITNPPWSKFRAFLNRSMGLADNIVFLSLLNAWFMKARMRDMEEAGFGIKEVLLLNTPPKPWPQTGFQLAAVHIQHGWAGPCSFTKIERQRV